MKVVLSATAARDFAVAVEWWRKNRPAVPTLLEDEMGSSCTAWLMSPSWGRPSSMAASADCDASASRRAATTCTTACSRSSGVVWVVRLWHMSRSAAKLPKR